MTMESELHCEALLAMMNYFIGTRNQGLFVKPTKNWDRKEKAFMFVIHSQSDFDHANNHENWRRI